MKHIRKWLAAAMALCLSLSLLPPARAAGGVTYGPDDFEYFETDPLTGRLETAAGLFPARKGGLWGLVDADSRTAMNFVYDGLSATDRGTFAASSQGTTGVLNPDGSVMMDFEYYGPRTVGNNYLLWGEKFMHGDLTPITGVESTAVAVVPGVPLTPGVEQTLAQADLHVQNWDMTDNGTYWIRVNRDEGYLRADGQWVKPLTHNPGRLMDRGGKCFFVKSGVYSGLPSVEVQDGQGHAIIPGGMYSLVSIQADNLLVTTGDGVRKVVDCENNLLASGLGDREVPCDHYSLSGYLATNSDDCGRVYQNGRLVGQFPRHTLTTVPGSDLIRFEDLDKGGRGLMRADGTVVRPAVYTTLDANPDGTFRGVSPQDRDKRVHLMDRYGHVLEKAYEIERVNQGKRPTSVLTYVCTQQGSCNTLFLDGASHKLLYNIPHQCTAPTADGVFAYQVYNKGSWGLGKAPNARNTVVDPYAPSGWAKGFIDQAADSDLVPQNLQYGYTASATRADFCALAVRLYETATGTEVTGRVEFPDSANVNIQKAAALGVISGIEEGGQLCAKPNDPLTREQAAVMLCGLAKACGQPLAQAQADFTDVTSANWSRGFVGQVQKAGIMSGVDGGRFDLNGSYTREQSILTMLKIFGLVH